jgi:hypothetical protein
MPLAVQAVIQSEMMLKPLPTIVYMAEMGNALAFFQSEMMLKPLPTTMYLAEMGIAQAPQAVTQSEVRLKPLPSTVYMVEVVEVLNDPFCNYNMQSAFLWVIAEERRAALVSVYDRISAVCPHEAGAGGPWNEVSNIVVTSTLCNLYLNAVVMNFDLANLKATLIFLTMVHASAVVVEDGRDELSSRVHWYKLMVLVMPKQLAMTEVKGWDQHEHRVRWLLEDHGPHHPGEWHPCELCRGSPHPQIVQWKILLHITQLACLSETLPNVDIIIGLYNELDK